VAQASNAGVGRSGGDLQRVFGAALLAEGLGVDGVAAELVWSHPVFDVVDAQERGFEAYPGNGTRSTDR